MAKEVKSKGKTVDTTLAVSLHKKFRKKCKDNNTSMAQVLRDAAQKYVK